VSRDFRNEREEVSREASRPSHSSFCVWNRSSQRRSCESVMEKRSQSFSTVEKRRKYSARTRRIKNRP